LYIRIKQISTEIAILRFTTYNCFSYSDTDFDDNSAELQNRWKMWSEILIWEQNEKEPK